MPASLRMQSMRPFSRDTTHGAAFLMLFVSDSLLSYPQSHPLMLHIEATQMHYIHTC